MKLLVVLLFLAVLLIALPILAGDTDVEINYGGLLQFTGNVGDGAANFNPIAIGARYEPDLKDGRRSRLSFGLIHGIIQNKADYDIATLGYRFIDDWEGIAVSAEAGPTLHGLDETQNTIYIGAYGGLIGEFHAARDWVIKIGGGHDGQYPIMVLAAGMRFE